MADSIPTVPLTVIQTSISLIIDIVLILVSAEMIFNSEGISPKAFFNETISLERLSFDLSLEIFDG